MVGSFYQDILYQAKYRPNAAAVMHGTQTVSYARFAQDIDKFTRLLARENLAPGGVCGIVMDSAYAHWLVAAAFARLGVLAASVHMRDVPLLGAVAIVTGEGARDRVPADCRVIGVRADWLEDAAADLPPFKDMPFPGDAPFRVVLSSGTTGRPKQAVITYDGFLQRARVAALAYNANEHSRFLTLVSIHTIGGFAFPLATWCAGGTVVLAPDKGMQSVAEVILGRRPTSVFMSPTQLAGLLKHWPKGQWAEDAPNIYVGGGPLPQSVNQEARLRISPALRIIYGSTEGSTITMAQAGDAFGRPGFVGYPVTSAQVEVVDDLHQPVPVGQTGVIRVRGEGMSLGYRNDPQATAQHFRDGWFYPGDTGSLDAEGGLTVRGRLGELMNLGGVKVAPDAIDEAVLGVPGLVDAASFAMAADGADQLWIAAVFGEGFEDGAVLRRYREAFPGYPLPKVARVQKIPRNEMGKVMRGELRTLVQQALQKGTARTRRA